MTNIGRAPGQSQDRWAHLLGEGVPDVHDVTAGAVAAQVGAGPSLARRVAELEERLGALEEALGIGHEPDAAEGLGVNPPG